MLFLPRYLIVITCQTTRAGVGVLFLLCVCVWWSGLRSLQHTHRTGVTVHLPPTWTRQAAAVTQHASQCCPGLLPLRSSCQPNLRP
jgi:hypothetical protein